MFSVYEIESGWRDVNCDTSFLVPKSMCFEWPEACSESRLTMASLDESVTVSVVIDSNPVIMHCSSKFTAEELCTHLCNKYNIPPLTRTLFALRVKGTNCFLKDNSEVLSGSRDYELRIRFMVSLLVYLNKIWVFTIWSVKYLSDRL